MKHLHRMIRPVRSQLVLSVLMGTLFVASTLAFVWISRRLIDIATGHIDAPIGPAVWTMAGVMVVQIVLRVASTYWENYMTVRATNRMRYNTFERVIRSRWYGKESFHSGDTVNRIEEDVRVIVDLVCVRIPDSLVTVIQLIAASAYLLSMSRSLVWMIIALMAMAVVGSKLFFRKIRSITAAIRAADSRVQQHIQENLQNRLLVLTLIGVEKVLGKLEGLQKEVYDGTIRRMNYSVVARSFLHVGFRAGYAAAFFWGIFGIKAGTVTFGMMTAFLQLVGQIQRPIEELSRHIPAFIHSLASIDRIVELEELSQEQEASGRYLPGAPGLKVRDLTFAYPGPEGNVFEHFSCDFEPGRMTVIAGPTGAGKSTLVKILMALLKPQDGSVTFYGDGIPDTPSDESTRVNFMFVPQGNSLLSGTIRENLALACDDATIEEMEEALRTAKAEFVFELKDGLDTVCGEDGSGLSEGQAQRIAVARALLHRGGVLIMDESTSALDAETEKALLKNLHDSLQGRKTIIFISHREAVSFWADHQLTL